MTKHLAIFLGAFAALLFFLTPNVNTGDAGELITASYFMGTAHPSAYPLYLQIGKTLTFLPFGNMAFRVALVSALFSALGLTLLFGIVLRLTGSLAAALFSATALFTSYSFFTQSVIAKFYPLNLFFVLLVFYLGIKIVTDGYEEKRLLLAGLILGLITANHHTGILMAGPFLVLCFYYRKSIAPRSLLIMMFLFIAGAAVNLYIPIRGSARHFFNAVYVNDWETLFKVFFRAGYGQSTLAVAGSSLTDPAGYLAALKNFGSLLTANFSLFSLPLFFTGIVALYRSNRRVLVFSLLAFALYGPFLAKLTFSMENASEYNYYVAGHQYFLPAFAFYVLFLGAGLAWIEQWLTARRWGLLAKAVPVVLALFPLSLIVARATDSNFRTNHVPYQVTKDSYSSLPANSILLSFADDAIYQGWYLKLLGRYREDICQLSASTYRNTAWGYQGCSERLYTALYPGAFKGKLSALVPLMQQNRFYATNMVTPDFPFAQHLTSRAASLVFLYLPKNGSEGMGRAQAGNTDAFLQEHLLAADTFIVPEVCLQHRTDDLLTRNHCNKYAIHLFENASRFTDDRYGSTGMRVNAAIAAGEDLDDRAENNGALMHYAFQVTSRSMSDVLFAQGILDQNRWKNFYLRKKR